MPPVRLSGLVIQKLVNLRGVSVFPLYRSMRIINVVAPVEVW